MAPALTTRGYEPQETPMESPDSFAMDVAIAVNTHGSVADYGRIDTTDRRGHLIAVRRGTRHGTTNVWFVGADPQTGAAIYEIVKTF